MEATADLKIVLETVFPQERDIDQRPLPGDTHLTRLSGIDCDAVFTENLLVGNL